MTTFKKVPGKLPDDSAPCTGAKVIRTTDSPNCTSACGWLATVLDGKIIDVKQAADYGNAEYNPRGCLRGAMMPNLIYNPDRIKKPMIRTGQRGEGKWREVSWDEALDHIADKFKTIIERDGPESILLFNQVVGTSYVQKAAQVRLFALMGGSFATAYDFNGDISMGFTHTVGIDAMECESYNWSFSDHIFLWSSNVLQTRIPDAHFITRGAKEKNNAKIIYIDPRASQTAKAADLWVPVKPGTDGLLALSMCHVLVKKELVNLNFLKTYTDAITLIRSDNNKRLRASDIGIGADDEFVIWDENRKEFSKITNTTLKVDSSVNRAVLGRYTARVGDVDVEVRPAWELLKAKILKDVNSPEHAAKIIGIAEGEIVRMAVEFAKAKSPLSIIGMGLNHRYHGDLAMRSIILLHALVGGFGRPGAGITIYSGQHNFRILTTSYTTPDGKRCNMVPMHYFVMGGPTKTMNKKIKFPRNGFKALLVSHGNPLVTEWSSRMKAEIDKLDIFVTIDFLMTPTAEYSDVVLPAATPWEKYDLVGTALHPYLQIQQPVIEPLYESKTELWMVRELAKRISPELSKYFADDEFGIIELILKNGGPECSDITLDALKKGPVRLNVPNPDDNCHEQFVNLHPFPPRAYPFEVKQQREFLKTGRMEFYKEEDEFKALGEELPTFKPPFEHLAQDEQKYPFAIVTPHSKWRVHSTHSNNTALLNLNRKPVVEISSLDACTKGINDGDEVELFNKNGSYRLWARVTETIRPGVLCVDHGWWDRYLADKGHYHSVTVQEKIKPTHENYYLPAVYAPGQLWKDTLVDIRRAP
jgi:anaerobic selenocysteine-containing dehydrogenase